MEPKHPINPWLTMWIRPRETMRYILEHYPKRLVHTLAICGAFTHFAGSASFYWYTWWVTFLIWIFMAIFAGLITLYVFGGLIKWTGNWLKGKAPFQHIMSAIAWSQIPVIYFFVVEMILLLIFGGNRVSLVYTSFRFIFAVWGFVIFLCCLMEAQAFSFFKSVINYVLAIVIFVVIAIIVNIIIALFSPSGVGDIPETSGQRP